MPSGKNSAGVSTGPWPPRATNDDRYSVYSYGPNADNDCHDDRTRQTAKTVHEGLNDSGDLVESTTYPYNRQGRMSQTLVDVDGDGEQDTKCILTSSVRQA